MIVTADELTDPYDLEMTCTIVRDGKEIFSGRPRRRSCTARSRRLIEYLMRANRAGRHGAADRHGIIVTEEAALAPGDVVTIRVPEIGELCNCAAVVY